MVDAVFNAVGDGAVIEQAGKTPAYRVEQAGQAGDIQKSVVLAGKTGGGQIFGSG